MVSRRLAGQVPGAGRGEGSQDPGGWRPGECQRGRGEARAPQDPSGWREGSSHSGSTFSRGRYDPDHVCNASDSAGRYSFAKQPEVCKWNLQKLAEALVPELPLEQSEAILAEEYDAEFHRHYLGKMRRKLGLVQAEREEDAALVAKLLETMHLTGERAVRTPPWRYT